MAETFDDNIIWLALDVILYALHDLKGKNEKLKKSAEIFFSADSRESHYRLWLELLKINTDDGVPTPDEIAMALKKAGYRNPLDARASKLHQLPKAGKNKSPPIGGLSYIMGIPVVTDD